MPRRRSVAPRTNLQVEVPPTLVTALDLIAENARAGEGVTRSHLIRSVLTEYVELKLGPNFRQALVAHERFGGDVLQEFVKQAIRSTPQKTVPQVDVLPDEHRMQGQPIEPERRYEPAPEHQASLEDAGADPATAAPIDLPAEQYLHDRPHEPLPQYFPLKPSGWKGFA